MAELGFRNPADLVPEPKLLSITLYCKSICLRQYLKTGKCLIRIQRVGFFWQIRRTGDTLFSRYKFSPPFATWGPRGMERGPVLMWSLELCLTPGSVLCFFFPLGPGCSSHPVRDSMVKLIIGQKKLWYGRNQVWKHLPNSPCLFLSMPRVHSYSAQSDL